MLSCFYMQVLQADGGTRVAAINAAVLALASAGVPLRDLAAGCAAGGCKFAALMLALHAQITVAALLSCAFRRMHAILLKTGSLRAGGVKGSEFSVCVPLGQGSCSVADVRHDLVSRHKLTQCQKTFL